MNKLAILIVVASVAAATSGGVLFAFSTFVMRAVAEQPVPQGIATMQSINVTVINPLFMGAFLGAAPLLGIVAYMARAAGYAPSSVWLVAAFAIYVVGTIGVTMLFNVPRNDRLAQMPFDSAEAATYWPIYVREWLLWNHVRCAAALTAAAAAACALVGIGRDAAIG